MRLRATLILGFLVLAAAAIAVLAVTAHPIGTPNVAQPPAQPVIAPVSRGAVTHLYGHNLELRQGAVLRVYIPWVRGELVPADPAVIPSLDRRDSFILHVDRGVARVYMANLARFLNSGEIPNAPFSHVSLTERHGETVMHATVQKLVPLPSELVGTLSAAHGNLVAFHVRSLRVLKVPLHGLLGVFHLKLSDLFQSRAAGIRIDGNTIYFNAEVLPPAPHLDGNITRVHLIHDALGEGVETIYGDAHDDTLREQNWRDFLELRGGSLTFGRLTMQNVDLILIDRGTKDPWFDLDLVHYQTQLVYGITRITPQAGLQIYMPSLEQLPHSAPSATITHEWLRDRNLPAPPAAPVH